MAGPVMLIIGTGGHQSSGREERDENGDATAARIHSLSRKLLLAIIHALS